MGMNNDDIQKMIDSMEDGDTSLDEVEEKVVEPEVAQEAKKSPEAGSSLLISQDEMDSLLSTFVSDDTGEHESLLEEIHSAILDSAKLTLIQWVNLRKKLREIEELIPHIDLLIRLKSKKEKEKPELFD